jgi:RimJ/RimL family protein N-acetyltransferase
MLWFLLSSVSPEDRIIHTARLCLRLWREEDREPFAELNADPVVMGFSPLPPWTRDESDASFNRIQKHWSDYGFGVWVVEIQGQFAGTLGFHRPRFEAFFTPCVEIGYRLMPRWWNQGFATEAGQAALCYVFERVGLEEIVAYTTPTNVRSRRVMEKLGMQYSGDFDHPGVPESGPMGLHVLYRLPRSKWVESTHPSE